MPYYHCNSCHHEFEHLPVDYKVEEDWSISIHKKENMPKCDWCDGDTYILEKETPLEKMCKPKNIKKILGELVAYEYEKISNNRKH